VAVFNRRGRHLRTFEARGRLNAPWGLAIAPHHFGPFSNTLLVGNFGDGTIVGINLRTGKQLDYLRNTAGRRITIDGHLYWTAGFNDEVDGGFGSLHYVGTTNPEPADREE
jgi:uncharacterized protein (TIGR03118 family)